MKGGWATGPLLLWRTVFSRFRAKTLGKMHGVPALSDGGVSAPSHHTANGAPRGTVRLCAFASLTEADRAAWQALGTRAIGEGAANIFAQPWVLGAGLRHVGDPDVTIALVDDAAGLLIGIAPLIRARRLGRFPLRHWQLWNHPNSFCAPLLVRPGQEPLFWDLLLTHLAETPGAQCALAIPDFPADSASFGALEQVAGKRGWRLALVESHARAQAVVAGDVTLDRYWDSHVRAKKRKELRRQAARMAELGTVSFTELAADIDPAGWIEEFLALEQAGWKGAAHSALAAETGTSGYFREVLTGAQQRGQLCALAVRLDGRAIAMLAVLIDGDAAFSFKTSYDESLSRFSPGVQIQRFALEVLARRGVRWADSCAAPNHPMIDSLWVQRRTMNTVVASLPGTRNRLVFAAYLAALRSWRMLKSLRGGPALPQKRSDDD
jgi:CelD/BcsL family acetyltransferase involved in cellulose biosynthesis